MSRSISSNGPFGRETCAARILGMSSLLQFVDDDAKTRPNAQKFAASS